MFCIPFVIVLAINGSIYLFKPQIDAFADRDVDSPQVTGRRATGEAQVAAAIAFTIVALGVLLPVLGASLLLLLWIFDRALRPARRPA